MPTRKNNSLIAVLIPAHNEEAVIERTIKSLLPLVGRKNIYVVSDGSVDITAKLARRYSKNVLEIIKNKGKAQAMNLAIEHFGLVKRYQYIMPMDADTEVDPRFIGNTLPYLENDQEKNIACVVGKVVGRLVSWVNFYRVWEYEIAQIMHKRAQEIENAVIVCPGCATIFRAEIFEKFKIPTGTLTEDMDFTFLLHRKKVGKILFTTKAVVVTQDPKGIKDYIKQINRWYTGFWQCVQKHHIPWRGQMLDLEVGLLASEGLFNGLLVIWLILILPLVIYYNPKVLLLPFIVDFGMLLLPSMLWCVYKYKTIKFFIYIPHFYLLRILSSLIFLKSFCAVVLGFDLKMSWNPVKRYQIKEKIWLNPSSQL